MKDKNTKNLRKSMNRGSIEHETKVADYEGEIMTLAKKEVISIPPTKTIKEAAEMMIEHGFRRLPVTHPGSNKLLGIVTAMDILDFLGGGSKFDIIEKKHEDNFLSAINDSVKEIMTREAVSITPKYSIRESVDLMLEKGIGSLPIVDKEDKLVGIVTERDFALALAGSLTTETVGDIILRFFGDKEMFASMTSNSGLDVLKRKISEIIKPNILVTESNVRLGDLCDLLAEKNIGGVPVVDDEQLVGIVTERDILNVILKD